MADNVPGTIRREIVGFTKPRKILFFTLKPRPIYKNVEDKSLGSATMETTSAGEVSIEVKKRDRPVGAAKQSPLMKNLGPALVEIGLKITPEQYIAESRQKAIMAAGGLGVLSLLIVLAVGFAPIFLLLPPVLAIIVYLFGYQLLLGYPVNKIRSVGSDIEKDVLFAARDMIVSMRSGVPLFNAMATVSVGYGAASREFEKVIDRVQLGMPMDQAIDEVSAKSGSPTFKKLMLQASTSIKVGSDVIGALQEVINDVSQERVIELRRYGQRLNAIAMFYMLFGVIFPSMGIAVAAIMSTFISIFTIDNNTLVFAIIGLAFLQFIFLNMVASSRPSFAT